MLDFNVLFNKIFASSGEGFDPGANYFTVMLNCAGKPQYYTEFDSQRRMYMGDSYYKEVCLDPSADVDDFRNVVLSFGQSFSVKVNIAYVFLMDFVQKEYEQSFAREALNIVREFKQPGDTVAVIAVLPADPDLCDTLLGRLEKDVLESEVLYLYHESPYREKLLAAGICGVTMLHSSKKHYGDFRKNEQAGQQMLNAAIAGLPAEGAAAIKAKRPILWSTLGCSFSNPKMEHLLSYFSIMCDKAKKLSDEEYSAICGELYSGMAEDANKAAIQNLLYETVQNIPRVTKELPKFSDYTLKDYFDKLFGYEGYKAVELSFKVTLAMRPNALNDTVVVNVANILFERAAAYHSEDLYSEVCAFLADYRSRFERKYDTARSTMGTFIEQHAENDSYEEDLRTYIDNYIRYYEMQKRSDFWGSVENYVRNHKHQFVGFCEESKALYDQLQALKKELQFSRTVGIDRDVVRSYSVREIYDAINNPEICREIVAVYKESDGRGSELYDVEMEHLCKLSCLPGFSTSVRYEMVTGNGGYTAYLKQNLGKYLHFVRNRERVNV